MILYEEKWIQIEGKHHWLHFLTCDTKFWNPLAKHSKSIIEIWLVAVHLPFWKSVSFAYEVEVKAFCIFNKWTLIPLNPFITSLSKLKYSVTNLKLKIDENFCRLILHRHKILVYSHIVTDLFWKFLKIFFILWVCFEKYLLSHLIKVSLLPQRDHCLFTCLNVYSSIHQMSVLVNTNSQCHVIIYKLILLAYLFFCALP